MSVPVSQMWTVASYVIRQKLAGRKQYPLVLMLEPLFRCNLACAGCGKIQYPAHILKRQLTPEECFNAVDECGAPVVSIPGGEPLMHPEIDKIVEGLVARKKYIYLCTNALLLKEKIHLFKPTKYLTFSVHLDGQREHHDFAVCREGGYDIVGWQKPFYLLQDGYAETFDELIRETEWANYGTESGNPHCANCMVHSGYEASAVNDTFGSMSGFLATVKATFSRYPDSGALRLLDEPVAPAHPLVQIAAPSESLEETRA